MALDNYPPPETVRAALAALLTGKPDQRAAAASLPRDAWPPQAGPILDAATALESDRHPVPHGALRAWLRDRGIALDGALGDSISHVYSELPISWVQDQAIRDLSDRRTRHGIAAVLTQGATTAQLLDIPVAQTVQATVQQATSMVAGSESHASMTMPEVCTAVLEYVSQTADRTKSPAIPGVAKLIGEYLPGELYVIAARPGMGKTAYALGECMHMAARGVPVYIQSLEMPAPLLGARMLGVIGGVDVSAIIQRDPRAMTRIEDHMVRLSELPIRVWDDSVTVELVCQRARIMHARGQCGVIMIDYLQLMRASDPGVIREQQIAHMSRELKGLAKDLSVPVIAVCQLNRASEARKGGEPMLSDLRESGQIEQDACSILFPHRPGMYDPLARKSRAFAIIAKNRYGDTGKVEIVWDGPATRFLPVDHAVHAPDEVLTARRPPMPPPPPDYD
jgi:replicative DNA helicase